MNICGNCVGMELEVCRAEGCMTEKVNSAIDDLAACYHQMKAAGKTPMQETQNLLREIRAEQVA